MMEQQMGLMWVGEKYYNTAEKFTREGHSMGVSKRIAHVPRDLVVGETWVLLAHSKTIVRYEPLVVDGVAHPDKIAPHWYPGIFQAFKPSRIEYVVKGTETEDELNAMEKRGITLINVIRDVDLQSSFTTDDPTFIEP
jgi:hypothetical protein